MWAVPTFVLATWWSRRVLASAQVNVTRSMRIWWVVGTAIALVVLGIVTSSSTTHDGGAPIWAVWGVVAGVVGPLLATDISVRRLPLRLSILASSISLVALSIIEGPAGRVGPLLGALGMTTVTYVLRVLTKRSLGLGDVYLSPLLGAIIGWFDPAAVLVAWVFASVFGAVVALLGLARGKSRDSVMPYGPALLIGTALALVGLAR